MKHGPEAHVTNGDLSVPININVSVEAHTTYPIKKGPTLNQAHDNLQQENQGSIHSPFLHLVLFLATPTLSFCFIALLLEGALNCFSFLV